MTAGAATPFSKITATWGGAPDRPPMLAAGRIDSRQVFFVTCGDGAKMLDKRLSSPRRPLGSLDDCGEQIGLFLSGA
jgi:hypothetical protein